MSRRTTTKLKLPSTAFVILCMLSMVGVAAACTVSSEDAYIRTDATSWTLGTNSVERVISLEGSKLVETSFKDKATGRELSAHGSDGPWKLNGSEISKGAHGELQLDLTVGRAEFLVTRSYVVYPGSTVIREWTTLKNTGSAPLPLSNPSMFHTVWKLGAPQSLDFHWMTGAENVLGSWTLRTEQLETGATRDFDSNDPFPGSNAASSVKLTSSSYAPWTAFYDHATRSGLFVGWDYFGHWASSYGRQQDGSIVAQMRVAGYENTLAPGESISTPKVFVGLFHEDLDNAGNELLDWQYRYLWDYTREAWFPTVRLIGNWDRGTLWSWDQRKPGFGWLGGIADDAATLQKAFKAAELMRRVGADVYNPEWGWWDRAGDWNGPDFSSSRDYLQKSGLGQIIYVFPYTVSNQSRIGREHRDWVIPIQSQPLGIANPAATYDGGNIDVSRPAAVKYLGAQMDSLVERWGNFQWRNDGPMTAYAAGGESVLLKQDEGLRTLISGFLDRHPAAGFQAVNGGGWYAGYDYLRYASALSMSDGGVGIIGNHWASLLFPPDKLSDFFTVWGVDDYDKSAYRRLLTMNFDLQGDTTDAEKIKGVRELIGLYHYLKLQGVVGRWVHVFRPSVSGDDPTMYFERLSRDGRRGIIVIRRAISGFAVVTVKPKGLRPDEQYTVSYQESDRIDVVSGAQLMKDGIILRRKTGIPGVSPGELIYLNLAQHPGSPLDTIPPSTPTGMTKKKAENMGQPGVELEWQPASDNNWLAYYEILRNGVVIDTVAKGTFYFDHSLGADLAARYEVRAVDGAENRSPCALAPEVAATPANLFDDASGTIRFSSGWVSEQGNPWFAYGGSIRVANSKSAAAELTFTGRSVAWVSRLGPENGKAAVSIDGGTAEVVDTYSADEIWGATAFRHEFNSIARHSIRIEVLGQRGVHPNETGKDALVVVDGIRVE